MHRFALIDMRRTLLPIVWGLASLTMLVLAASSTSAQEPEGFSWEYSPYDIQVWLAFGPSPVLTEEVRSALPAQIEEEAWAQIGPPWKLTLATAPAKLHDRIVSVPEKITSDQLVALDVDAAKDKVPVINPKGVLSGLLEIMWVRAEVASANAIKVADTAKYRKVLGADKVLMVAVDFQDGQYVVRAREFDCRTRVMGRLAVRRDARPHLLAATVLDAMLGAFSPLVRIESSKGKEAVVRVRAGGLIESLDNPVAIRRNSLLQPVIRKNDRYGDPKRIDVVEWTFLRVDHQEGRVWVCEVQTAMRNPLTGRGGSRTLKVGLGVRPEGQETRLQLVSLERVMRDGKEVTIQVPMEGFEIFAKNPLVKEDGKMEKAIPLGRTDWRGMITVPRDPNYPLRLIYVKNGRFLLARLPLIPGLDATTVADLTSDDQRLEVEAFVRGIEANVTDVVTRRHILATLIRRRLAAGNAKEARQFMEEFARLPGKDEMEQIINARMNAVKSPNQREQKRIEAMLKGVKMLIARYLDDGLEGKLREEMRQAGVLDTLEDKVEPKPQPKNAKDKDDNESSSDDA